MRLNLVLVCFVAHTTRVSSEFAATIAAAAFDVAPERPAVAQADHPISDPKTKRGRGCAGISSISEAPA